MKEKKKPVKKVSEFTPKATKGKKKKPAPVSDAKKLRRQFSGAFGKSTHLELREFLARDTKNCDKVLEQIEVDKRWKEMEKVCLIYKEGTSFACQRPRNHNSKHFHIETGEF